jgi:heme-degrading monooxygenase HmoA
MKRRTYLKNMLAGAAGAVAEAAPHPRPIQLHVDLSIDPAKEKDMLHIFHTKFRSAASAQPGFLDAKMLKLRSVLGGAAPEGANYRFVLVFQSEEQRQHWVATPIHQQLWPAIENTLTTKNYNVLLYDVG